MMRRIVMPVPSKDKTVKIQYVDGGETMTGRISPVTMNFMENGYVVLKNFIPKEIITMTLDAWKVIENEETHNQHFFHREEDIIDIDWLLDNPFTYINESGHELIHCCKKNMSMGKWCFVEDILRLNPPPTSSCE